MQPTADSIGKDFSIIVLTVKSTRPKKEPLNLGLFAFFSSLSLSKELFRFGRGRFPGFSFIFCLLASLFRILFCWRVPFSRTRWLFAVDGRVPLGTRLINVTDFSDSASGCVCVLFFVLLSGFFSDPSNVSRRRRDCVVAWAEGRC